MLKPLLRIVLVLGLLYAAVALLPKLVPETPGMYTGVAAAPFQTTTMRPSASAAPTSVTPTLPPGFPSMEFPPPEIEVPEGDPIPIDTKYGISYTVPGDWKNASTGVAGWESDAGSVTYGAVAMYGYDYCPEHRDGARKAVTGMTGRRGVDVPTAAFEASRQAELIFRDAPDDAVVLEYSAPTEFDIDGAAAIRYSVHASNIAQKFDCDPTKATFDVVATEAFSNAPIAVFMVHTEQGIDGALTIEQVDQIVSTLHRKD